MQVQKFLRENSLEELKKKYGIKIKKYDNFGESDEILTYFPELKNEVIQIKLYIQEFLNELNEKYENTKNIKSQKEFDLKIKIL